MGRGGQNWRAFRPVMHLHENHNTKRAGVAGIRARAKHNSLDVYLYLIYRCVKFVKTEAEECYR